MFGQFLLQETVNRRKMIACHGLLDSASNQDANTLHVDYQAFQHEDPTGVFRELMEREGRLNEFEEKAVQEYQRRCTVIE